MVSIMRSRRIPNIALEALVDIYIISSCQDKYGWESLTHVESEIRGARFYAFKLDLGVSVSSKTIDVFHVKYLRPTIDGPYRPSVTLQPLPVTEDDDEPEYEIDRILDRKRCRGKFEYLVQYKGYPLLKDCQWRPHDEVSVTAPIILEEFTTQFSKEPATNNLNKRKWNTIQKQSS